MSGNNEEKATKELPPKRLTNPEEWKRLRSIRVERRKARRESLKKQGFRPNRKMTRCKKTGKDLRM